MNEVIEHNGGILAVIERAAGNPDVDVLKMEKLLEMAERVKTKDAEISFIQAMTRLQPQLPVIKHTAKIRHNKNLISTYAKYEDIDVVIKPLYSAEGFSVSFNSKRNEDSTVTYSGTLSHKDGHSKTAEMVLPADTSGAKNSIQAIGSTISYAKRYLVAMLFNLVTAGEDDDAKTAVETIDTEQAANIDSMIRDGGFDRQKFLDYMGIDDVRQIRAKDQQKALNSLRGKPKGGNDAKS